MDRDPLGSGQNILSLDICSTADSQVAADLAEALHLLRAGASYMYMNDSAIAAKRAWVAQATRFTNRFPDFD